MPISSQQKGQFQSILNYYTLQWDGSLSIERYAAVPVAIASAHPIFDGVTLVSISRPGLGVFRGFALDVNPAGANVATYAVGDGEVLFAVYDGDGI